MLSTGSDAGEPCQTDGHFAGAIANDGNVAWYLCIFAFGVSQAQLFFISVSSSASGAQSEHGSPVLRDY